MKPGAGLVGRIRHLRLNAPGFAQLVDGFDEQRTPSPYLPLTSLLLRPIYRLLHWRQALAKLISHYLEDSESVGDGETDLSDCRVALDKLTPLWQRCSEHLNAAENLVHMAQLETHFSAIEGLFNENRVFLREGSLQRLSRKGATQRMFVLFNDCLLYASRQPVSPQNPLAASSPQHQNATTSSQQQGGSGDTFKLHGVIPLRGLMMEDGDPLNNSQDNSPVRLKQSGSFLVGMADKQAKAKRLDDPEDTNFTLFGPSRSLVLSAASCREKRAWMEDIALAISLIERLVERNALPLPTPASSSPSSHPQVQNQPQSGPAGAISTFGVRSPSHSVEDCNAHPVYSTFYQSTTSATLTLGHHQPASLLLNASLQSEAASSTLQHQQQQHQAHANDTVNVCWHRSLTVAKRDLQGAGRESLSGYLLRKFRNSAGWQKLWVVYGHFSLFFYKSHREASPLASLPLLGYWVGAPLATDQINKDCVFKLAYKSHSYFFRADCQFAFDRWLEVLQAATCSID